MLRLTFALGVVLVCTNSDAGGPLLFNNSGPIVWDTTDSIAVVIDEGPLKPADLPDDPGIDAAAAARMIDTALSTWEEVPTAAIAFQSEGTLGFDVDTGGEWFFLESNLEDFGNFVVFDQEGEIIDAIVGPGQSNFILGFAAPIPDDGDTEIVQFISLMNGKLADGNLPNGFLSTIVHEFGHAIGLDHAQIKPGNANDNDNGNDGEVPTMFPTSTDSDDAGIIRDLHSDDVAWLSHLYPVAGRAIHGTIQGILEDGTGNPILGANVVARNTANGDLIRFSCVSDYLANDNGEFLIPVTAGQYRISVVPIRMGFDAGSSVGPHSETASSPSFTQRVKSTHFDDDIDVTAGNSVDIGTKDVDLQ